MRGGVARGGGGCKGEGGWGVRKGGEGGAGGGGSIAFPPRNWGGVS